MAQMTILEAATHFGVSKEAIHNRIRRGSLLAIEKDGVKYVDIDKNAKTAVPKTKAKTASRRTNTTKASEDKYYKMLEEQNTQLQGKVEKLEGETRNLRDQKEAMLIAEREKIEQVYKDKDEQLKNILTTLSSQFMLNAPASQEHLDAEIQEEVEIIKPKGELISLKKYLKRQDFSEKKKEKIKNRFVKNANQDERVIVIGGKFYIDTVKFDYRDLIR